MTIAILGAGKLGMALARLFTTNGIAVQLANSREPQSLESLAADLGPLVTPVGAHEAATADVLILAVNWMRIEAAISGLGPWKGRILVDATNAVEMPAFRAIELGGRLSTAIVAGYAPGARVVKAFNHLSARLLQRDPRINGGRRVLFLSGDEASSKAEISTWIRRLGYTPMDLGNLQAGRMAQFPFGPLFNQDLVQVD